MSSAKQGRLETKMEQCMVFPVLPGQSVALIKFAEKLMGERKEEFDNSQLTVLKEQWYLQPTPMGDFCIVHVHAADPMAVFKGLATSEEPFDVWFREQVKETTGVDLTNPPSELPLCIFDWKRA